MDDEYIVDDEYIGTPPLQLVMEKKMQAFNRLFNRMHLPENLLAYFD